MGIFTYLMTHSAGCLLGGVATALVLAALLVVGVLRLRPQADPLPLGWLVLALAGALLTVQATLFYGAWTVRDLLDEAQATVEGVADGVAEWEEALGESENPVERLRKQIPLLDLFLGKSTGGQAAVLSLTAPVETLRQSLGSYMWRRAGWALAFWLAAAWAFYRCLRPRRRGVADFRGGRAGDFRTRRPGRYR